MRRWRGSTRATASCCRWRSTSTPASRWCCTAATTRTPRSASSASSLCMPSSPLARSTRSRRRSRCGGGGVVDNSVSNACSVGFASAAAACGDFKLLQPCPHRRWRRACLPSLLYYTAAPLTPPSTPLLPLAGVLQRLRPGVGAGQRLPAGEAVDAVQGAVPQLPTGVLHARCGCRDAGVGPACHCLPILRPAPTPPLCCPPPLPSYCRHHHTIAHTITRRSWA